MGTRSLTVLREEEQYGGEEIVVMYRQMDGYLAGHGADLKKLLNDMVIVNGLTLGQPEKVANGSGCLAAQVVAHFKDGPGGIYLHPGGSRDLGEEFIYTVTPNSQGNIKLLVEDVWNKKVLYDGLITEFDPYMDEEED